MKLFAPKLFTAFKGYQPKDYISDVVSGVIVAIIALPLSIALAIASGAAPETGLFTAMYTVLPNRKNRFFAGVPGALLASVGWLVFSNLYSVYVEKVSGYASLFGSVYGVVLSMLWLYFCICILFYGGALNHWLEKRR